MRLNGVDVTLKLTLTKDVFNLIAHDFTIAYKSVIKYEALIMRKVEENASIALAHENILLQSNPCTR